MIWETVLRDAAGPLSAYYTPTDYALESLSLRPVEYNSEDFFLHEIRSRLDLGRTHAFTTLLPEIVSATTSEYRHKISFSQGGIRGKIHVPRLIAARARGDRRGIPVIRAERQLMTPENLLVSEVLRLSLRVAKQWASEEGAESKSAIRMISELQGVESSYPWVELRARPRPVLRELVSLVLGRVRVGITMPDGPIHQVAQLFADAFGSAAGFEQVIGESLRMLVSQHPAFEDKVFELLCVGWLVTALSRHADNVEVNVKGLRGTNKRPLLVASYEGRTIELYFQTSMNVLPKGRWIYRKTRAALRGTPDIVLRVTNGGVGKVIILDAKNRSDSTESEVTYKLLGYKENWGLSPFYGVGIYPSLGNRLEIKRLDSGADSLFLVHVPLLRARRVIDKVTKRLLASLVL
jgi:hypothetical protein